MSSLADQLSRSLLSFIRATGAKSAAVLRVDGLPVVHEAIEGDVRTAIAVAASVLGFSERAVELLGGWSLDYVIMKCKEGHVLVKKGRQLLLTAVAEERAAVGLLVHEADRVLKEIEGLLRLQ